MKQMKNNPARKWRLPFRFFTLLYNKTNINIITIVNFFFYSKTSTGAIFTSFYSQFHKIIIQAIFFLSSGNAFYSCGKIYKP